MARPSNPRGKDKPRSIVLDGDVAEIAQRLADNNALSSTLSELLRSNYGFGDAIEEKKRQMHAVITERQRLAQVEADLEAEIDAMEVQLIEKQTTIRPQIEKRITLMTARRNNAMRDMNNAIDSTTRNQKHRVIQNLDRMIADAQEELEALR